MTAAKKVAAPKQAAKTVAAPTTVAAAPVVERAPSRICAFCGQTAADGRGAVLPAPLYLESMKPELPSFASLFCHVLCAREHRERHTAQAVAHALAAQSSKRVRAPRVEREPRTPKAAPSAAPTFETAPTDLALLTKDARVTLRVRRLAAQALGLTLPNAYWGLVRCTLSGTAERGSATLSAPLMLLPLLAQHADDMHAQRFATHATDSKHMSSVLSALRSTAEQLRTAVLTPKSANVMTF